MEYELESLHKPLINIQRKKNPLLEDQIRIKVIAPDDNPFQDLDQSQNNGIKKANSEISE